MIRRDQVVEGRRTKSDLIPDGGPEPRDANQRDGRRPLFAIRQVRDLEESGWMGNRRSWAIGMVHRGIIASNS
jgi:hypothetical protein